MSSVDAQSQPPTLASLADRRVAVCMVGATRSLVEPGVYLSIRKNLLDAQLVPTDLFLHLHLSWDHSALAPGMGHHGAEGPATLSSDSRLKQAIRHLKPVDVELYSNSGCDNREMTSLRLCRQVNRGRAGGIDIRPRHGVNSSCECACPILLRLLSSRSFPILLAG